MVSTYRLCRTISVTSLIGARLLMDTVAWFFLYEVSNITRDIQSVGARMQHRLVSRNSMRARTSKAFFAQGLFETAVDVTHHSFSAALLCSSSTVELLATVLQLLEHTKKDNDECVLVGG
jgi:hypothetical protein